jgi:hypothetical protein
MRIETGRINYQLSFGFTIANYHNEYRAFIIDFAFWYIEFIFQDYEEEENKS